MTIVPLAFDDTAHTVTLWDTAAGHGGTVSIATLTFSTPPSGAPDYHWLAVPCPVCSSVSYHPCGGGAAPREVQRLFVRRYLLESALSLGSGAPGWAAALVYLRQRIVETDGLPRFQLAGLPPNG